MSFNETQFCRVNVNMKTITIAFCLLVPALVFSAETAEKEYHSLDEMLTAVKLEKIQVETMVDTMVKSGRISNDEGERARRAIASVQEEDLDQIKNEAIVHIKARDLANK